MYHPLQNSILNDYLHEYIEHGQFYSISEIVNYLNARQDVVDFDYDAVKRYSDYHSGDGCPFLKHRNGRNVFYQFL